MSKRRLIDEKIRESQTFSMFTYRQRDLWHGLIVSADDQGRMPGSPNFIGARIWPYDGVPRDEVEADLAALEQSGNIHRYTINGAGYIQIVNWWKYQQMQWAGPSNHPAPDGWADRLRYHAHGNKVVVKEWDKPGGFIGGVPTKLASRQARKQASLQARAINEGEGEGEVEGKKNTHAGAKTAPEKVADPVKELAAVFEQASGIKLASIPKRRQGPLFWHPLGLMLQTANGDAPDEVRAAVNHLRKAGMTISDPNSILKTFNSIHGKSHSAPTTTFKDWN